MSIEITNVVHAMATVAPGSGVFFGQANVGFAPFGTTPDSSEHLASGQTRMHLLQPLSFVRGEGLVLVNAFTQSFPPAFPLTQVETDLGFLVNGPSQADILVQTKVANNLADIPFMILVLRFPQQSTSET